MDSIKFRRPRIISAFFAAAICLISVQFNGCRDYGSTQRPYLILYAFDTEGKLLAEKMTVRSDDMVQGRIVYAGKLSGLNVILAESGVGMTNAAMTTQKMIDEYEPTAVIFSGIAGGIDTSVRIGDIVIPSRWATHDYGYYGADGFAIMDVDAYDSRAGTISGMIYFNADSVFMEMAEGIEIDSLRLDSIGDRMPRVLIGGVGVSGNSFIDQVEKRLWLSEKFGALTTDMESTAVAQVCKANGIPFIIFRSASDLAGGSGSESAREEISQFFEVAADNSAQVVMSFLKLFSKKK
jgi:adenosylhomocysteine nucleosidase